MLRNLGLILFAQAQLPQQLANKARLRHDHNLRNANVVEVDGVGILFYQTCIRGKAFYLILGSLQIQDVGCGNDTLLCGQRLCIVSYQTTMTQCLIDILRPPDLRIPTVLPQGTIFAVTPLFDLTDNE